MLRVSIVRCALYRFALCIVRQFSSADGRQDIRTPSGTVSARNMATTRFLSDSVVSIQRFPPFPMARPPLSLAVSLYRIAIDLA